MATLTPGLNPNLRIIETHENDDDIESPIDVELLDDNGGEDQQIVDDKGNVIRIEHADGTVTISMDGKPIANINDDPNPPKWFDNLVDKIDEMQLGIIANELITGVEDDLSSRQAWIDQRVEAMKMLGWKPDTAEGDSGGSPDQAVEGTSRVHHPMMAEAVLRFHANAVNEMLPVDGPVKIHDDDNNGDLPRDQLADALQKDFNHYLTKTAKEYYPDTDRMLMMVGFGGLSYKKVFYCPLRNRPVSESVDANDLVVNNNATSLETAKRITHRMMHRPSTIKRMQILGIYRDIALTTPNDPNPDALKLEELDQQGLTQGSMRPEDRDRELYEVYCELNIIGFEHKLHGKPTGLEVPYRVTIDVTSRQILAIVRNYDKGTEQLPIAKIPFVMYIFVPGFGYYPLGLLHIMSNMTNAATAAWRIMLDNGMFANFPGFLIAKAATRQNTMVFRVAPGSGVQVDTNGMDIGKAIMPLPYKTEGMAALFQLTKDLVDQGQRVGMTAEMPSQEGREDVPVGTTLAMIEQAQKVLSGVHKRVHRAQAEEFNKILDVFREHPESFWQCNNKPAHPWDAETFRRALKDCNLVPKADPNTASQLQRLMKIAVLKYLQSSAQSLYDPIAVDRAALEAVGYTNPDRFFAPPAAQARKPPELELKEKELAIKQAVAQAQQIKAQSSAQKDQSEAGLGQARFQLEAELGRGNMQIKAADSQIKNAIKSREVDQMGERDLTAERVQLIDAAQNLIVHPESAGLVEPLIAPAFQDVARRQGEIERKKRDPGEPTGLNPQPPEQQ